MYIAFERAHLHETLSPCFIYLKNLPYDRHVEKRSQLYDEDQAAPQDGDRPGLSRPDSQEPEASVSWRPSTALRPVERYGRFEVLGRIGRGGMAEILLARERSLVGGTRHLVIKRILPEIADDEEMLRMFLDEARVVMGLSHPNLCQIYDVGEHAGTWYIAMEWVNGSTLHHLIRRAVSENRVDPAVMARVIGRCAEALHHAHTARDGEGRPTGLVHRDVSPHNIMVAYDGRVKLLDFGIAKSSASTHRTEAGVVKGKVCYMAPEQWLSDPLDGRTDVFALGACLVEALTGDVVFRRDTQMEVMRAILNGGTPSLAALNPKAPKALAAIAERALAKRPQDRFQTALEMSDAIERFLATLAEPCGASQVAAYARRLLPAEVELGPVIERAVHAKLPAAPLYLPPVPPGLLGAPRASAASGPLPIPLPFQSQAPDISERDSGGYENPLDVPLSDPLLDPEDDMATAFDSDEAAYRAERAMRLIAPGKPGPRSSSAAPTAVDVPSPFDDAPTRQRPFLPRTQSFPALKVADAPATDSPPEGHSSFDRLARPLARTLSMPVVRSIGRIAFAVVPAAAAMFVVLYWTLLMQGAPQASHSQPVPHAPAQPAASPTTMPTPAPEAEAPMAAAPKREATTVAHVEPSTQQAADAGLLSINTKPWSTVYLGQRMLGTTPIARVSVPNRPLTLKLVDRDGKVHVRRIGRSDEPVREVFFDFEQ